MMNISYVETMIIVTSYIMIDIMIEQVSMSLWKVEILMQNTNLLVYVMHSGWIIKMVLMVMVALMMVKQIYQQLYYVHIYVWMA